MKSDKFRLLQSAQFRRDLNEIRELWKKLRLPPAPTSGSVSSELREYLKAASYRARLRLAILQDESHNQSNQEFRLDFTLEAAPLATELRLCERIGFLLLHKLR